VFGFRVDGFPFENHGPPENLKNLGKKSLEERCPLLIPLTFLPKKDPELEREAQSNDPPFWS